MALPVYAVAPMVHAVVSIAVAVAVVGEALIVVAVAFVAVGEGPRVDLVRLLAQSRRPSLLHGTHLQSHRSPKRPRRTSTPCTRPTLFRTP
jgi:hypothetical protein